MFHRPLYDSNCFAVNINCVKDWETAFEKIIYNKYDENSLEINEEKENDLE